VSIAGDACRPNWSRQPYHGSVVDDSLVHARVVPLVALEMARRGQDPVLSLCLRKGGTSSQARSGEQHRALRSRVPMPREPRRREHRRRGDLRRRRCWRRPSCHTALCRMRGARRAECENGGCRGEVIVAGGGGQQRSGGGPRVSLPFHNLGPALPGLPQTSHTKPFTQLCGDQLLTLTKKSTFGSTTPCCISRLECECRTPAPAWAEAVAASTRPANTQDWTSIVVKKGVWVVERGWE
jgi:hypothetical protein